MPIETELLTELEYQLIFFYLLDQFSFDEDTRDYVEYEAAVVKQINEMTPGQRRTMLDRLLSRNRDNYQSYCQAAEE